ncbi:antirestriction protein ArdA, partial [Clostridioides difficile]
MDHMAVYIANLGRYNEGYLVGAWFTFPIDE